MISDPVTQSTSQNIATAGNLDVERERIRTDAAMRHRSLQAQMRAQAEDSRARREEMGLERDRLAQSKQEAESNRLSTEKMASEQNRTTLDAQRLQNEQWDKKNQLDAKYQDQQLQLQRDELDVRKRIHEEERTLDLEIAKIRAISANARAKERGQHAAQLQTLLEKRSDIAKRKAKAEFDNDDIRRRIMEGQGRFLEGHNQMSKHAKEVGEKADSAASKTMMEIGSDLEGDESLFGAILVNDALGFRGGERTADFMWHPEKRTAWKDYGVDPGIMIREGDVAASPDVVSGEFRRRMSDRLSKAMSSVGIRTDSEDVRESIRTIFDLHSQTRAASRTNGTVDDKAIDAKMTEAFEKLQKAGVEPYALVRALDRIGASTHEALFKDDTGIIPAQTRLGAEGRDSAEAMRLAVQRSMYDGIDGINEFVRGRWAGKFWDPNDFEPIQQAVSDIISSGGSMDDLERRFASGGISVAERTALDQLKASLGGEIDRASSLKGEMRNLALEEETIGGDWQQAMMRMAESEDAGGQEEIDAINSLLQKLSSK